MSLQDEIFETLSQVGRAFGNGHRLALLTRLAQTDASVDVLASTTGLSVGNTSQHLQHLRRAGLVTARRSGKQIIYRLTDQRIITLMELLRQIAESNLAEMERLVSALFPDDDIEGALEPVSQTALLAGLKNGAIAMLIDVRSEEEYSAGHLPKAINIPLAQLESMLNELPRDGQIVAYCRGPYCSLSHDAVQRLRQLGYQVRRFKDGYPEWKAAGLPVKTA